MGLFDKKRKEPLGSGYGVAGAGDISATGGLTYAALAGEEKRRRRIKKAKELTGRAARVVGKKSKKVARGAAKSFIQAAKNVEATQRGSPPPPRQTKELKGGLLGSLERMKTGAEHPSSILPGLHRGDVPSLLGPPRAKKKKGKKGKKETWTVLGDGNY